MNDTDCLLSIVGLDGLIDGNPNAEFTVTMSFAEQTDTAVVALSVT